MNRAQRRRAAKSGRKAARRKFGFSTSDLKTFDTALLTVNRHIDAREFATARLLCEDVLEAAPELPEAHFALGTVYQESGSHTEAIPSYERAIGYRPKYFDAWLNLANCYIALSQFHKALDCSRRATGLRPDSTLALAAVANAHSKLQDHDSAADCLKKAVKIDPDAQAIPLLYADELRLAGRHREAAKYYKRAIALRPGWAEAHVRFGVFLQECGEFSRAKEVLQHALDLEPDNWSALMALVYYENEGGAADSILEKIGPLLQSASVSPEHRAGLNFAAARIKEAKKDFDGAFSHYRRGNELIHARSRIDKPLYLERFDRIIKTFDSPLFNHLSGLGSTSCKPVFIIGMPRSGTSLIEQILSAHPVVFGAGELNGMMHVARRLHTPGINDCDYLDRLSGLKKSDIRELYSGYLKTLDRRSNGEARVIDKDPQNFLRLGLISILFPNATIIHARRDPMDTCLSCYFQKFSTDLHAYSYDLGDLGFYYQHYRRFMDHWRKALPKPFLDVDYEALVGDPEPVVRKMLDFCGLDWNDACLAPHKVDRPVATASLWQVRQPIYNTSSGKWRRYEAHLGDLKRALGPYGDEG